MANSSIWILYRNIYETSTVTVTTENSSYPKERLYDRDIGKFYKATSTATQYLKADQGATTIYDIDTLIIPAGHNLDVGGTTDLFWDYSDNGSVWPMGPPGIDVPAIQNITDNDRIVLEATGVATHRYWRAQLKFLNANPELYELWMGEKIEFANVVKYGGDEGLKGNVVRTDSLSGIPHLLHQGVDREYRRYIFSFDVDCVTSAQRDAWNDFLEHSRYKPFWLKDLNETWYYMSLVDPNIGPLTRPIINKYEVVVEFIEVPQ
jgi:hypothetical protein